jgi:hypothetical protein
MALFKKLPDHLFYPLAGPNSAYFEAILTRLHELFFGPTTAMQLPSYDTVRAEIEEVIAGLAVDEWVPEKDDGGTPPEIIGNAAHLEIGVVRAGDEARSRVETDLETIEAVFGEVDTQLARTDGYRSQLERRVSESVRYLDKTQPGAAARISRFILAAGQSDDSLLETLPSPHSVIRILPLSARSPRQPVSAKRPPPPETLRTRIVNQAKIEQQKRVIEYLSRRRLSPGLVGDYLARATEGKAHIDGADLEIRSVEDFIAFSHVRFMKHLGGGGAQLARDYDIQPLDGTVDNEWITTQNFRVIRRR